MNFPYSAVIKYTRNSAFDEVVAHKVIRNFLSGKYGDDVVRFRIRVSQSRTILLETNYYLDENVVAEVERQLNSSGSSGRRRR